ncbi:3638_t:CDS:2, partial [Rhizophagus irregularis]
MSEVPFLDLEILKIYDLDYGWTLDAWDIDSFSSDFFRHGRIG